MTKTNIKEIFKSIQGEGPYLGVEQFFVRFCSCNLNCAYCDTNYKSDANTKEYTPQEVADIVNREKVHSVSLTGGEPLLFTDFLKEFIPLCKHKIYLETNATLPEKLAEIVNMIDIIAADLKIESATGIKTPFDIHDKFFNIAKEKELFIKIVFNSKITDEEIEKSSLLAKKYNVPLILQPVTDKNGICVNTNDIELIFSKFFSNYENVRLIPQMHKFLNIR